MAKSADAADLKSAGRKAVGVQVPLWAPKIKQSKSITCKDMSLSPRGGAFVIQTALVPVLVPVFTWFAIFGLGGPKTMPRKVVRKERGVFEKEPGSGIWWGRYYI